MLDKNTQSKSYDKRIDTKVSLKQLTAEQELKVWIKTLLSIQQILPEIIHSVDKIIESNASSLSFVNDIYNTEKSTFAQVEKVIDLTERKNKLLNIFVISNKLLESTSNEDQILLKKKYILNWTAEEIADDYNVSIRTIFRRVEKCLDKLTKFMIDKKWSSQFIMIQVKKESWIIDRFKKYAKESVLSSRHFELLLQ